MLSMILSLFSFLFGILLSFWRYGLSAALGGLTIMGFGLLDAAVLQDPPRNAASLLPVYLPTTLYNSLVIGLLALPPAALLGLLYKLVKVRSALIFMISGALCSLFGLFVLFALKDQPLDTDDLESFQGLIVLAGGAFAGLYYRLLAL